MTDRPAWARIEPALHGDFIVSKGRWAATRLAEGEGQGVAGFFAGIDGHVDPVTENRVDEPGRVAPEEPSIAGQPGDPVREIAGGVNRGVTPRRLDPDADLGLFPKGSLQGLFRG